MAQALTDYQVDRFHDVNDLIKEIVGRINEARYSKRVPTTSAGTRSNLEYQITFPREKSHIARASIKLPKHDGFVLPTLEHHYRHLRNIDPDSFEVSLRSGNNFSALALRSKSILITIEIAY
jgi:hypothetical protein